MGVSWEHMVAPVVVAVAARGAATLAARKGAASAVRAGTKTLAKTPGASSSIPARLPRAGVNLGTEQEEERIREASRSLRVNKPRRMARVYRDGEEETVEIEGGKRRGIVWSFGFFFVATLALAKDIGVDPLMDLMIVGGMGMSATIAGALIGIPIAGVAWGIKIIFLLIVLSAASIFFLFSGGIHTPIRIARILLWALGGLSEALPVAGLLPMTTVAFVATVILEEMARRKDLVGKITMTAVNLGEMARGKNTVGGIRTAMNVV